jgi:hydroxyacylglutathione hydrolase
MQAQKNNFNVKALIIGLGLIILISILTISKPFSPKKVEEKKIIPPSLPQNSPVFRQLSADNLISKMRNKEAMELIDIRSAEEFQVEHLINSQNISAEDFDKNSLAFDKDKIYVIIDDGENGAGLILSEAIAQKGFKKIYYLTGGFLSWQSNRHPTVSSGDPNSFTDQAKVNYINSDKLKNMTQTENNLYILDVRKKDAYNQGHLQGAANIFLDDLEKKREKIPINKKIVVYDENGFWAFQAAVRLFDMGIFNVYTLSDGFNAWTQKGFGIVK